MVRYAYFSEPTYLCNVLSGLVVRDFVTECRGCGLDCSFCLQEFNLLDSVSQGIAQYVLDAYAYKSTTFSRKRTGESVPKHQVSRPSTLDRRADIGGVCTTFTC